MQTDIRPGYLFEEESRTQTGLDRLMIRLWITGLYMAASLMWVADHVVHVDHMPWKDFLPKFTSLVLELRAIVIPVGVTSLVIAIYWLLPFEEWQSPAPPPVLLVEDLKERCLSGALCETVKFAQISSRAVMVDFADPHAIIELDFGDGVLNGSAVELCGDLDERCLFMRIYPGVHPFQYSGPLIIRALSAEEATRLYPIGEYLREFSHYITIKV